MDQRSWDGKVNWRTYDISIDCRAAWLSRLRYAWCDDCVCIEKTSRQAHSFSQKSKCRRVACSKTQPILTWERQTAYMIYEHFRATGAHEAVQRLSNLFSVSLQHDDVQDFDVRWDQAPLSASEHAFRCDPGRIVQVEITRLCSASDCLGFVQTKKLFETMDKQDIYDWRRL